jgi:hypothetical protein
VVLCVVCVCFLFSYSISLRDLTADLAQKENHPVLRELREMLQPTGNYKAFRKVLKQANPPLVPFVGCFQTDLVFIEDGNKILLPNGHTHFAKVRGVCLCPSASKSVATASVFLMAYLTHSHNQCGVCDDGRIPP